MSCSLRFRSRAYRLEIEFVSDVRAVGAIWSRPSYCRVVHAEFNVPKTVLFPVRSLCDALPPDRLVLAGEVRMVGYRIHFLIEVSQRKIQAGLLVHSIDG